MKRVGEFFAALAGAIASFFTGLPPIVWVLLAVMTIDYITGILCALMNKSTKTENGGLSSSAAFRGLIKKGIILLIVLLAALLDRVISMSAGITFEAVAGATCLWFIASEGMSIVENAANMGIPIPAVLRRVLEIMKEKGNNGEQSAGADQAGAVPGPQETEDGLEPAESAGTGDGTDDGGDPVNDVD